MTLLVTGQLSVVEACANEGISTLLSIRPNPEPRQDRSAFTDIAMKHGFRECGGLSELAVMIGHVSLDQASEHYGLNKRGKLKFTFVY